jgi:hypothetical protein
VKRTLSNNNNKTIVTKVKALRELRSVVGEELSALASIGQPWLFVFRRSENKKYTQTPPNDVRGPISPVEMTSRHQKKEQE